jgi:hypothetical protein
LAGRFIGGFEAGFATGFAAGFTAGLVADFTAGFAEDAFGAGLPFEDPFVIAFAGAREGTFGLDFEFDFEVATVLDQRKVARRREGKPLAQVQGLGRPR